MSEGFNNFIFYKEWLNQIRLLACSDDPNDILSLCDGLEAFLDGQEPDDSMSLMATLVYNQMTAQIARDKDSYKGVSEKRSEAGKKGAEAKWNKAKQTETKDDNAIANDSKPMANDGKTWQTMANGGLKEEEDVDDDVSPKGDVIVSAEDALITFPLAKGKEFAVTQEIFDMLSECYPAVNTMEELRKVKAWAISNPKRRKVDGMKFLNNWFSWEQDKGPPVQRIPKTTKQMTAEEIMSIPAINPWRTAT